MKTKKRKKVFITRPILDSAIILLKKMNYEIICSDKKLPGKEFLNNVREADAVISFLTDRFNSGLIDQMKNCKVIANYAVGFNNIDVDYAKRKGIIVTNTPDVLTDSTADLSIALALCCARRILEGDSFVRSKKFKGWDPKLLLGIELKNKIFGIVGAGRIGTAAAVRAKAFGSEIIYYSRSKNYYLENEINARRVSLNKLLKHSDFISLHLPLTNETYHLLNKGNMKQLKRSAIIVNTARGEIIDQKELIDILENKRIFGAGFDVYENEPKISKALLKLKNVVLMPHAGSATEDTRNAMAELAAKNVINVLEKGIAISPVL